jgi:cell division septum initiation protein DivIVA
VSDIWTKNRAKGFHREGIPAEEREVSPLSVAPPQPREQSDAKPVADVQQAMQMLTLAQRTADEHVAGAHRQAEQIHTDARAQAEQIIGEARAQAESVRTEADSTLTDAKAQAAKVADEAKSQAESARQDRDKIVAEARTQAAQIAKNAQGKADELARQAQARYEEMVGNLVTKRETLQRQIESLQAFDRDYRSRLLTFMQAQVRALWADEAQVDGDVKPPGAAGEPRPDLPGQSSGQHAAAEQSTEQSGQPTEQPARPAQGG